MRFESLMRCTLTLRRRVAEVALSVAPRADEIPPGWNNNLRWHVGHLAGTPRVLTLGPLGEELGIPPEHRRWFGKGTSPADWAGDALPSLETLAAQMVDGVAELFDALRDRLDEPFPRPRETSLGVLLTNPAEALHHSLGHDGIHLGLALALRRSLESLGG